MNVHRRHLVLAAPLAALWPEARAEAPPTLAMLGFELVDDHPAVSNRERLDKRLAAIGAQFEAEVERAGLYRLVDTAPAAALIAKLRGQMAYLYRCNGCMPAIGRAADAEYVAAGWVQKVSNLILNINVEIHETATDRVALVRSVDLRGNTDLSWSRGISYLVREIAERRAREPRYGL